jgi:hypothetical protein
MMKPLMVALTAVGILLGPGAYAQDVSGTWEGTLWPDTSPRDTIPSHTVLQISKADGSALKAVYYANIDASKRPIPVTSIAFADSRLTFSINPMYFHYLGKLNPDGVSITGTLNASILDFRRVLGAKYVTAGQLMQILAEASGMPDEQAARKLYRLVVMERLNPAEVRQYEASLPGAQSKQRLRVLVDQSTFLDPTPAEVAAIAKPDVEAQRRMIALCVEYVAKTMHQLPNLYATRVTTSFVRRLREEEPMRPAGRFSAMVLYRDGKERHQSGLLHSEPPGLTTRGEFGPILDDALVDAPHGNLAWDHWEQSPDGPRAVYRYKVAAENSHYQVDGMPTGYEGEITIDPRQGTVFRLVFRANLEPPNPLISADILVEYGPVELGGKTYICPVRSVALSRDAQLQRLNDVVFEDYHLYRANARLVTGAESGP